MIKRAFLFTLFSLINLCVYSQDSAIQVKIREPQKLISQLDQYVFGNGLHAKESDNFISPVKQAFLTTLSGMELMLGVKAADILNLLNGNIDASFDVESKIFVFRADYTTKELAKENIEKLKGFLAAKGLVFIESKEGEITCYTVNGLGNILLSYLNNSVYIQGGDSQVSPAQKKLVSQVLSTIPNEINENISIRLPSKIFEEVAKTVPLVGKMYEKGISYSLSFKDNSIYTHSEINVSQNKMLNALMPPEALSIDTYKLISQKSNFAIASKFKFSQILSSLVYLGDTPELKITPKSIEEFKLTFTKLTTLDLQKDLLNHLGDEVVLSAVPEEEAGGNPLLSVMGVNMFYIAVPLKNAPAFEASLVKLLTTASQLSLSTPFTTVGDGLKTIPLEGAKVYYIKFAQSMLTPCFLIKGNQLFIATNLASLEYINKNISTWGTISDNKEFQAKVPVKEANGFYYDKYVGSPTRTNYAAHLTSTAVFGIMIFCNYMGDPKINDDSSGEKFRMVASLLKSIVASIDFAQYPASKNFQQSYGDNYVYWATKNNNLHFYQKSGHIFNNPNSLGTMVFVTSIIATVSVPQLLEARRNSNQRASIGSLRAFATDQETYAADNNTYGTIAQLGATGKIDLSKPKAGFYFYDLIKTPTGDVYAIVASPLTWGSSGKAHYLITSTGTVRVCKEQTLPFKDVKTDEELIDLINTFPEAR